MVICMPTRGALRAAQALESEEAERLPGVRSHAALYASHGFFQQFAVVFVLQALLQIVVSLDRFELAQDGRVAAACPGPAVALQEILPGVVRHGLEPGAKLRLGSYSNWRSFATS